MSETKLQPCPNPWCKSPLAAVRHLNPVHFVVKCRACGLECGIIGDTEENAAAAWNTRAPDPRIAAADEMAKALKEAAESLNTIATQAGKGEYLKDVDQIRGYANSRDTVARAALAAYNATRPLTGQEDARGQE